MNDIPHTERAVQIVGPDTMAFASAKPVARPGAHQVLARVEAVGLCFSDLKLLKQFSGHARKSEVVSGIAPDALSGNASYVPGDAPTVPGHEAVVRIAEVGPGVDRYKVGDRFLVQTDYRWLPTGKSNAAFGYNFEGALQEFVLMDERVITSPEGESMLIPVPDDLAASAIALVEPWACVENAYAEKQRRAVKPGGRLLVVGDAPVSGEKVRAQVSRAGKATFATAAELDGLPSGQYDDIVYFGSDAAAVEKLFPRVAAGGLLVLVRGGGRFGRPVNSAVGRVHYGGIRVIGTSGDDLAEAYAAIPESAEIKAQDRISVVGAAGPMGVMHVVRSLSLGLDGVKVYAGDLNEERLAGLSRLAAPLAKAKGVEYAAVNPAKDRIAEPLSYIVLMVPVPALIGPAIAGAARGAIINVFAGIPAEVYAEIDLDTYVDKQLYFIGTSGSELKDMKEVLAKVLTRELDTNLSVAAVADLESAIEGIRAVEKNLVGGKILVYPSVRNLGLTGIEKLADKIPLADGRWTAAAESELLKRFSKS